MMARIEFKRRMKTLLMFLPNMVTMCGRLMVDPRVPKTDRALVAGAVVYAIIPLDFIPDFIPFIGQVDDVYLISLTLLRLMNRTDAEIVREHWRGGGDVVPLLESVTNLAPMFLPKSVRRVLESQVEIKPKGVTETAITMLKSEPILVEYLNEADFDGEPQ
jgi:uncharacterized membrane protein YkvA (DUF1232 family)